MSEKQHLHKVAWARVLAALLSVVGLFACGGLAGCAQSIESPEIKANTASGSVQPDLVCTQQLATNVVLTGSGFTPLPTKTLEGPKTELALPKIELVASASLDGSTPAATPIPIPDDPADPAASHVHFLSETQMSFDIDESLALPGGVYDVVVTNPDGRSTRWPASLALIPPPEVTELVPPAVCDDQSDQALTINGKYFLKVDGKAPTVTINGLDFDVTEATGCTALQGTFSETIEICSTITITIPVGSLMPGDYEVVVTNPGTASCKSTSGVKLTINPPPRVDAVIPQNVCSGGGLLTISGANFGMGAGMELPTVELRTNGMTVLTSVAVEMTKPGTELKATFAAGASPGTAYEVVVINPDGCEDRPLPHKQVNGVEGPILFYVDPPVVANAVNTRVTLYSTAINKPLPATAVWIIPTGQMMPITVLANNDVVGFPKRLQAVVPKDQAPGVYDVYLDDGSDCSATVLQGGLTVAADQNLSILRVDPPFGRSSGAVPITIYRNTAAAPPADAPFVATPAVFLNPAASTNPAPGEVGIEVNFVSMTDPDTLTAVVPENTPPRLYDVVVVNPDGKVGILADGYTSLTDSPPVIDAVTPPSVAASGGQLVVVSGDGFRAGATVSLSCVDGAGAPVASPPVAVSAPVCAMADVDCTMDVTIDATVLGSGSVCVLRVTNTDGSYGDFSAIGVTTPSLNLQTPKPGTDMTVGRRGLVSGASKATSAARFVLAAGGDDGTAAMVFSSVESAPVDLYGKMGAWALGRFSMGTPRVFAGSASSGRYLYVAGGSDGMKDLATVERAMLLSPAETPVIDDVDLALGDVGLTKGAWAYRVSATFDAADLDNPNGESLASDAFTIKLPEITGKKIAVILTWSAPKDSLGNLLPNVNGYRIYRTPTADAASGQEVLLATVPGAGTLQYTDNGAAMPGVETPIPLGSTGAFAQLPDMSIPRNGTSLAIGPDPNDPDKTLYLYALFGKDGASAVGSYELLPITVAANGHQTAAGAWTAGMAMGAARWHHGSWVVDKTIKKEVGQGANDPDTTFIYVGPGFTGAGGPVNNVQRAQIQPGGQLDAFAATQNTNGSSAGYGVLSAAGQLFIFGGDAGLPSTKGVSATIIDGNGTLANNSWNAGLSLQTPRAFMGSSVQSAFAFFIGGATNVSTASKTTELVVW